MKKPKAIYLYLDNRAMLKMLSDEEKGALIDALMDFACDGVLADFSDNRTLNTVFVMMRNQLERDFEKYNRTCEARSLGRQKQNEHEKLSKIQMATERKKPPIPDIINKNDADDEEDYVMPPEDFMKKNREKLEQIRRMTGQKLGLN